MDRAASNSALLVVAGSIPAGVDMNGKQIYIRIEDWERLKAQADEYRRTVAEQVAVLLDVFESEVGHARTRKPKGRTRK